MSGPPTQPMGNFILRPNFQILTSNTKCWEETETVSLPDLATEDSNVLSMWETWIEQLVANYTIDGLRVDRLATRPQISSTCLTKLSAQFSQCRSSLLPSVPIRCRSIHCRRSFQWRSYYRMPLPEFHEWYPKLPSVSLFSPNASAFP